MSDGKVVFDITGDTAGIDQALRNATNSISRQTAKWTVLGQTAMNGLLSVGKKAVSGIGALMKNSFDYNASMEEYLISFRTLLGSEEAAAAKIAELREYAAKTPFNMDDLAGATRTLLAFGLSSEDASEALAYLGDISLGDANRLSYLTLAFAQATSAGKLMGQDLLQMVNAGFNPLQIIAKETGAAYGDLRALMSGDKTSDDFSERMEKAQEEVAQLGDKASEGAKMLVQLGKDSMISADMIKTAMRIATSEGNLFYKALASASQTAKGQISTIQDSWNILIGNMGRDGFNYLSGGLFPQVITWLDKLNAAFDRNGMKGIQEELPGIIKEVKDEFLDVSSTIIAAIYNAFTGKNLDKTEVQEAINGILTSIGDTLKAVANFFTVQLPEAWAKVQGIIDKVSGFLGIKTSEAPDDYPPPFYSFEGWSDYDIAAALDYIKAYAQVRAGNKEYQDMMNMAMVGIVQGQGDEDANSFAFAVDELFASIEKGDPVQLPAEWMDGTDKELQEALRGMDLSVPVSVNPVVQRNTVWAQLSGFVSNLLFPNTGQAHAASGIFPGTTRFLHTAGESGAEAILPLDTLWRKLGLSMDASFAANLDALQYRVMPPLPAADPTAAMDGDALGMRLRTR